MHQLMRNVLLFVLCSIAVATFAQSPEERLNQIGIHLPDVSESIGSYVHAVRVGNLIYLSGKGPRKDNGEYVKGKLGQDLTILQGYEAARLTAINQLAVLKDELGDLRKVKRIVKVNGFVNSANSFYDQPQVINGFSDLLIEVFGNRGKHARTAIGTNVLPLNMAVEVEMIVEVE
jgi:enamine deaminase RidA (YjgF/YER057c/UK114 family)